MMRMPLKTQALRPPIGVFWSMLGWAVLAPSLTQSQDPPATIHAIAGRGGVAVQGFNGVIREIAGSKRHLTLSVAPKVIEESVVGLKVIGLDAGRYYLCVSGSDPRIVSSTDMAQGTQIHLPAVVGAKADALHEAYQEWTKRLESAQSLAAEFGLSPEEAPEPVKSAVSRIETVGEGLAETAAAREAVIRLAPVDAGLVPLPFPRGISGEELISREETLQESCLDLIRHVNGLDRAELRDELLRLLVPIELGKVSGSVLEAASGGSESGTGELSFDVTNPQGNPALTLDITLVPPEGWEPLDKVEWSRKLAPGESQPIKAIFRLSVPTSSGRTAIALRETLRFEGIEITRGAGIGFGHDFIRKWRTIGPFENLKNRGTDLVYPPEEKIDLDAAYEGLGGTVGWKEVTATERGYIDLKLEYEQNTNCLAYGAVWIYSPRSEPVVCASGSNDGIQVWMNGREVFRYREERGAEPESDLFPARLQEGWNLLLVKSLQTGGNWGFYFEIRDQTGAVSADWKFSAFPPE